MTDVFSSARLKRLYYQSGHRGTKELDIILGRFAESHLKTLSEDELVDYEILLDGVPEATLYDWLTGTQAVPPEHQTPVLQKILDSLP